MNAICDAAEKFHLANGYLYDLMVRCPSSIGCCASMLCRNKDINGIGAWCELINNSFLNIPVTKVGQNYKNLKDCGSVIDNLAPKKQTRLPLNCLTKPITMDEVSKTINQMNLIRPKRGENVNKTYKCGFPISKRCTSIDELKAFVTLDEGGSYN